MTTRQFLRKLARRWPLVLALVLLGAGAGWVTTPEASGIAEERTVYRATNVSFIEASSPSGLSPRQVAFFATFDDVPELVAAEIDADPDQLAKQVRADADVELGILEITATSVDAERAELIADTFAEQLRAFLADRAAQSQASQRDQVLERIEQLEQEIRTLDREIAGSNETNADIIRTERDSAVNQLRVERERLQELQNAGSPSSGLRPGRAARALAFQGPGVLDEALSQIGAPEPEDDRNLSSTRQRELEEQEAAARRALLASAASNDPDPVLRAGVGGTAGAAIGLGIIALLAYLDRRVRDLHDAEAAYGLPVLVEVPPLGRKNRDDLVLRELPTSRAAEAYRSLRTSLTSTRLTPDHGPYESERDVAVLMVNGPTAGAGATTTAANVAVALAETRLRVLLVDCDFRDPTLADHFVIDGGEALDGAVEDEIRDDVLRFVASTEIEGVSLARTVSEGAAPETSPAELIASQRALVRAARPRFDVIVLDTAPGLETNDAGDLLPVADAVVFAARSGHTKRPAAVQTTERFERLSAPMAGVVLLGSVTPVTARRDDHGFRTTEGRLRENGRSREPSVVPE